MIGRFGQRINRNILGKCTERRKKKSKEISDLGRPARYSENGNGGVCNWRALGREWGLFNVPMGSERL